MKTIRSHPDFKRFWAKVQENHEDNLVKLVMADWLDEHDLPWEAKALRYMGEHDKWPKKTVRAYWFPDPEDPGYNPSIEYEWYLLSDPIKGYDPPAIRHRLDKDVFYGLPYRYHWFSSRSRANAWTCVTDLAKSLESLDRRAEHRRERKAEQEKWMLDGK